MFYIDYKMLDTAVALKLFRKTPNLKIPPN